MSVNCFTSASFGNLDRARVLANTIRRFHPDWVLWLCLADAEPQGFAFDPACEPFDCVVRLEDLGIEDVRAWIFGHDLVELCTAVKGPMLARLLTYGASVVCLDPDIALFAALDDVIHLLETHSVVLTPHVVSPERTPGGVLDNEIGSLKHGVYSRGFLAVRPCAEGQRFAAWWRDRLLEFHFDDVASGLFIDQRWCDLAPALFEGVAVLRDKGYNVASWNLGDRPIGFDRGGTITAGGRPLRFFHFSGVDSAGERRLDINSGGRHEAFELLRWYRQALATNRASGVPDGWWAYGRYACGTLIRREERVAWRAKPEVWGAIGDPFQAGPLRLRDAVGLLPDPH
ncbi:MAG TPA: hypothetical protein VKI44_26615 [Acetobacteraceae bacterium]|nr:hypothetical protein [Acetobacteraceae bacterium]